MISPWRMVAIALAVLGFVLVVISFVTCDIVGYALTNHGCHPMERRPSIVWLAGSVIPFALAAALWLTTKRIQPRR